jgi:HlyD family type I secretion membrane fusion protein
MRLDLGPVRSGYVAPTFGADQLEPIDPRLEERLRRPMVVGAAVIGSLVVGLGLWAALTPLASGVSAMGEVEVESNLKTLRHRDPGIVHQILVHEGQLVQANQPLIIFDDNEPRSAVAVLQNQADTLMAQAARAQAEALDKTEITWPVELTSRASDPRVAGLMRDQQLLFTNRQQLYQSQTMILQQRLDQIQNQIVGDQAQMVSNDEQARLTDEEMGGYKTLYAKGYAPKSLILKYQRSMAEMAGHKGSLAADIARLKQQQGETRIQITSVRNQRDTTAADEIRDAESKLADVLPRLATAKLTLDNTVVRAPVTGYVFNLTQFTQGGAAGSGEVLMQVVPANAPLFVQAMVKPQDIESVHVGMDAKVRILALNPRWHGPMDAKVVMVAPDKMSPSSNQMATAGVGQPGGPSPTTMGFYRVDVRIEPKELTKLKPKERITPGMPANVTLVSGKRTLMGFLVSPITDTMEHAFHEQ